MRVATSEPVQPLARSVRMSNPDYPGALRSFPNGWRLVVSPDGRRYRLQVLAQAEPQETWASPPALVALSLSVLCARGAAVVEGLAEACAGLPEDPSHALPDLVARREALLAGVASDREIALSLRRSRSEAFFEAKEAEKRRS